MAVYVCSDIHGLKDRYDRMMKAIHEDDTLYVIGDVIDRGEDGIVILCDLLSRDNVVMMPGNHEYMMLRYYQAKSGLLKDPYEKNAALTNWSFNHNTYTMQAFEALSEEEQEKLLIQLETAPAAICNLHVNEQCYYLVHGCPSTILCEGTLTLSTIQPYGMEAEDLLWNRMDPSQRYFMDRCVITGHTPTLFFQKNEPYEVWYQGDDIMTTHLMDIDCGCAAQNMYSRVALLCLDDRSVRYF